MNHGEILVDPFVTHHPDVQHCILMFGDTDPEPWLCWKHPDGQWVTECKVTGKGLCWSGDDEEERATTEGSTP